MSPNWLSERAVEELRSGLYADPPYVNLVELLNRVSEDPASASVEADVEVETHWIPRRQPFAVVAGIPRVLEILQRATGRWTRAGHFIPTAEELEIWAVPDGSVIETTGIPIDATPAVVVKGRYSEFACLKTPALGTLARASRIATNTYRLLLASRGKPIYTFAARYDPHETQALDGYSYAVGVSAFARRHAIDWETVVSTQANASRSDASTLGTLSHEAIACFRGRGPELMLAFCSLMPTEKLRIALLDFDNDCVLEATAVLNAVFPRWNDAVRRGDGIEAAKYRLDGVRLDTSGELTDRSLQDTDPHNRGVNPALARIVRRTLDQAWESWNLTPEEQERAREWCRGIKIIVSGGFTEDRIAQFEDEGAPVDAYGVGTALLTSSPTEGTVTDFSAGVVRVKVSETWIPISKVGRRANWDPRLERIT